MQHEPALQPPSGCPAHQQPIRLYTPEFAADPQGTYEHLRTYGPAAPVELAPGVDAMLVTSYSAARSVLQNADNLFSKNSFHWRALREWRVPQDSPVLPMMSPRPNCMFSDGAAHLRLREAVTDSLNRVDSIRLSRDVKRIADYLIDQFSGHGEVDLLNDYAKTLPLLVFNQLFGCPGDIGDKILNGMSAIFDGIDPENANAQLTEGLMTLVALKREAPGADVTSWLISHHAGLSDEEMVHQLVLLMGAGTEPQRNLIANSLRLLLSDDKYSGQFGGSLLVDDAIDDVLLDETPISNYAAHYALQDVDLGGVHVPAGVPLLISFAAANTDPAVESSRETISKRSHLAWGAGPHVCPAKDPARLIVLIAIEELMNRLPDVDLAVPVEQLVWRPGPFHRALDSLPATFTPMAPTPVRRQTTHMPDPMAHAPVHQIPQPHQESAQAQAQAPARHRQSRRSRWSAFLDWLGGV